MSGLLASQRQPSLFHLLGNVLVTYLGSIESNSFHLKRSLQGQIAHDGHHHPGGGKPLLALHVSGAQEEYGVTVDQLPLPIHQHQTVPVTVERGPEVTVRLNDLPRHRLRMSGTAILVDI